MKYLAVWIHNCVLLGASERNCVRMSHSLLQVCVYKRESECLLRAHDGEHARVCVVCACVRVVACVYLSFSSVC